MNNVSICFDFDGTLVKSEESILFCLNEVLREHKILSIVPLNNSVIGPPLQDILKLVTGYSDANTLESLATDFKKKYDTEAYKTVLSYEGIQELLSFLKESQYKINIATNKRINATKKIISHLAWDNYFEEIIAIDSSNPPFKNKSNMLALLAQKQKMIYIGDTKNDFMAANENKIDFIGAGWGYGDNDFKNSNDFIVFKSPVEVINHLT